MPDQVVAQFRTRAARALLGRRTSMSPFLALSVLFPFPLDPEAFLLVQALRTLWRVLRVMPKAGQCWLQGTVDAHLREERPIGPASSLAALLRRNDWTLSGDGVARGPRHWKVDLFSTCPAAISHAVHRAWCSRLPDRLRSRNGMRQLEVPCPMATHRALRRFSAKAQRVLGLSITGAFLSSAGSATWDVLQDPNCPLCGALCTKEHQVLTCPATSSVRARHSEAVQWMSQHARHWVTGASLSSMKWSRSSALFTLRGSSRVLRTSHSLSRRSHYLPCIFLPTEPASRRHSRMLPIRPGHSGSRCSTFNFPRAAPAALDLQGRRTR